MKLSADYALNSEIKLNDYEYIFIKYIDEAYVDYLINTAKITGKRLYVADYSFNTLYDKKSDTKIIDPNFQMDLESEGNILSLVSLYNKRRK